MLLLFFATIIVIAHISKPYFERKKMEMEIATHHHHNPPVEYLELTHGGIRKHMGHTGYDVHQ